MKNKGTLGLLAVVVVVGLYAYFGEYKREIQETEKKEKSAKIITLQRDQIKLITLDKGDFEIALEKTVDGWNLVKPVKDEADNEIVESFLDQITGEKTVDVIEREGGINWAEYGLAPGLGHVILENNSGQKESVEVSMKKNFEGLIFLRKDQGSKVLTSSHTWVSFLTKPVDGFRNLRLFRSSISKVNALTITNTEGSFKLENKEAKWISSEKPQLKLDQNAVREILTQISLSKGTALLEKKSVGQPTLKIELQMDQEKWIGQFFPNSKTKDWNVSISSPALNIQFAPQTLEQVRSLKLTDLRDKTYPFLFDRELVQKIKLKNPLKTLNLYKQRPEWKLEKEEPGFQVNSVTTQEMIEKTHRLQVYKYLNKPVSKPEFTSWVQYLDEKGKPLFEMKWSDFKNHEAYMTTSLTDEIFQIDDAQINRLMISDIVSPLPAEARPAQAPPAKGTKE